MGASAGAGPSAMSPPRPDLPYAEARRRALLEFDRQYIQALLERTSNNISQAARAAGLDRSNFKRVLRRVRSDGED
jgi:DNA-binding NtrC family response regulator